MFPLERHDLHILLHEPRCHEMDRQFLLVKWKVLQFQRLRKPPPHLLAIDDRPVGLDLDRLWEGLPRHLQTGNRWVWIPDFRESTMHRPRSLMPQRGTLPANFVVNTGSKTLVGRIQFVHIEHEDADLDFRRLSPSRGAFQLRCRASRKDRWRGLPAFLPGRARDHPAGQHENTGDRQPRSREPWRNHELRPACDLRD